jgi:hypothetical protein
MVYKGLRSKAPGTDDVGRMWQSAASYMLQPPVKLALCLTKHYDMKVYRGVDV